DRPENQLRHGRGKRKAGFLLYNPGEQVVGRMLFMQKFRSRLKEQRTIFDLLDESGRSLMMIEDIAVVGELVDVRKSGALHKQSANRDLVSACNAWDDVANLRVEADRALIDEPQNRGCRELH